MKSGSEMHLTVITRSADSILAMSHQIFRISCIKGKVIQGTGGF